ncbi:MAG: lamin tail domain-containing protein [Bacteroidia bacterium]|nr:lamin tail domain-containing protein [Bacteroidia bacterium]
MRIRFLLFWGIFLPLFSIGQVRLLRFVPGSYRADNLHLIELYNYGNSAVSIGGWLIVTRDYSVRIPLKANIQAKQVYRIGKKQQYEKLHLELSSAADFLIRMYSKKVEGNYVIVFDHAMRIMDAFYYSWIPEVPFLPDSGICILANQDIIHFNIPTEKNPVWKYFSIGDDPAIGFAQQNGKWRPISSNIHKTHQSVGFGNFSGRYKGKQVELRFDTQYEDNPQIITIQRSTDQEHFKDIATITPTGSNRSNQEYLYLDSEIAYNKLYYYRIKAVGIPGQEVYSKTVEVQTKEISLEFWMDIFPDTPHTGQGFNLRIYSAYSQYIRVILLDTTMRDRLTVYSNYINAESQLLIQVLKNIPAGTYWILATTDRIRYRKKIVIQ